ncbi:MAG TPA: lipocalin-like domain-containing protein [Longimicrobium sp.]|nr:lipocalin-like domain-containing protein [Longimicrobium sp.]
MTTSADAVPVPAIASPPSLDPLTLQGIAQALWMKEWDRARIPHEILERVESEKNGERAWARRFLARLDELEANQRSFVPSRAGRYALLRRHLESTQRATPRQLYASNLFFGPESNVGYEPIPLDPRLDLPGIDLPQLRKQLGWHFFVGNFTDAEGSHYSVELMFWQYSLLPPPLAARLGLSDIENQSLEMHLAICDPQANVQYRAATMVVAGTTGLIEIEDRPFAFRMGRNSIEGEDPDGNLFPVRLRARGWDMGKTPDAEIDIDISLENELEYFKQGDEGCAPSVDGLGTLYYSASLLGLRRGRESSITIAGRRIVLTGGRMWYDHQWTTGFMPPGAAKHAVMRAAANLSPAAPGGWDWFEFQFDPDPAITPLGEAQMTLSALHSAANAQFYNQSGPTPPGPMTAPIKGKLILPNGVPPLPADPWGATRIQEIAGTMTVTAWVKNETSPDPAIYPVTHVWYPAGYRFQFDDTLPAPLRDITARPLIASGQMGWFGNGLQYTEGGAVVHGADGREIGRGFAEGTGWAHSNDTAITLAGLPLNDETRDLLTPVPVSFWLRVISWVYALVKSAQLKRIMSEAKGL